MHYLISELHCSDQGSSHWNFIAIQIGVNTDDAYASNSYKACLWTSSWKNVPDIGHNLNIGVNII